MREFVFHTGPDASLIDIEDAVPLFLVDFRDLG